MSSEAKRAAAAVRIEADASAARTPTRPISVHLTPFAPLCARLPIDHPKRWRTFYGRTVEGVVRSTLERVRLAPGAARALREVNDDVSLLGPLPPELVKLHSGERGELVPFAIFWDGLSAQELQATLERLVARGWRPGSTHSETPKQTEAS